MRRHPAGQRPRPPEYVLPSEQRLCGTLRGVALVLVVSPYPQPRRATTTLATTVAASSTSCTPATVPVL